MFPSYRYTFSVVIERFENSSIHPQTLRLGLQFAEGVISGSNARCVALLSLLKIVRLTKLVSSTGKVRFVHTIFSI